MLWITGPAGVGKSTASWQVFSELSETGVPVAFVDSDQLCMCYPAPAGDPGRQRIKALNAAAVVSRARAAGARCVIANGVLDPARGVLADLMPQAEVTTCLLRADAEELAHRLLGRRWLGSDPDSLLEDTLAEASAMDISDFAYARVDTTGVAASEVAGLIRGACRDWAGFREPACPVSSAPHVESVECSQEVSEPAGHVLLVCGPAGVGKSTIGFRAYQRFLSEGLTAGYIDLEQVGFLRPAPESDPGRHQLKAGNLADMWHTYRAAGATHLIATGPIDSDSALKTYRDALPTANVTVCRLHAGPIELRRRIMSRGAGGSWPEPGDPLRGQPAGYLTRAAAKAAADADALERAGLAVVRIDTDGLTITQSAGRVAELVRPVR